MSHNQVITEQSYLLNAAKELTTLEREHEAAWQQGFIERNQFRFSMYTMFVTVPTLIYGLATKSPAISITAAIGFCLANLALRVPFRKINKTRKNLRKQMDDKIDLLHEAYLDAKLEFLDDKVGNNINDMLQMWERRSKHGVATQFNDCLLKPIVHNINDITAIRIEMGYDARVYRDRTKAPRRTIPASQA